MEVGFKSLLLILSSIVLVNCSSDRTPETVTPVKKGACVDQDTLTNKYIVSFKSGKRIVVENADRESFISDFVEPNFDLIEEIEFDRRIALPSLKLTKEPGRLEDVNWGVGNINAESAWQRGIRGKGAVVAVVDTGVDTNHVLLKNRIFVNDGETGFDSDGRDKRTNGIDDDENGYVDDVSGFNFVNETGAVRDYSIHGTHVSGIIAAEHFDTDHIANKPQGVAPEAKILPIAFLGPEGGTLSDALDSLDYAMAMNVDIINASWGGNDCSSLLASKIIELGQKDILFIAAAGNAGANIDLYPEYPASFRNDFQITVGSVSFYNGMAAHSNYGDVSVNVFAPGVDILSTLPFDRMGALTGTSMATPFVAGFAALIKSQYPELKGAALRKKVLQGTVKNESDGFVGSDYRNTTQGRIDIKKIF